MEIIEIRNRISDLVSDYLDRNEQTLDGVNLANADTRNHIVNIGTSILCTKWDIGYPGGSFVQSVVDNDLMRAVANADSTNIKALRFYCHMMYNVAMPMDIAQAIA